MIFKERFEKYFNKYDDSSCWIWKGGKMRFGYGTLRNQLGKQEAAHRISYRLYKGDFDKSLCVLHKCDNPSCVNPGHLFLGTRKDNSIDRQNKGRGGHHKLNFKGCNNPNSKLSEYDKNLIRDMYCDKKHTQKEIAKIFNVERRTIIRVLKEVKL